jgi:uncharacterized SAM-binding protein YcdF (DUF218 family)
MEQAAIVVLGAAVLPDGTPGPALARRIAQAARLWREGRAAAVIGSGALGDWPPSEARAIRDGLLAAGVPAAAILEEDRARSTFENALNSVALMRARGLARAIVVTDAWHLPRAVLTFRLLGMAAEGSAPPDGPARLFWRLREAVALPVYMVRVLAWRLVNAPPRRP